MLCLTAGQLTGQGGAIITISQQPTNTTVEEYNSATFSVTARVAGAPSEELRYHWQVENMPSSAAFTNLTFATQAI